MTRKMNRRQNASSSRKHSSALKRFCFNASYLVPAVFIHFLLSRLFFAYHESELNISPTFLRAAAQLECEDTGPSEKSSRPACIRVARVDFVTSYVTLTFVYCMLYDLYIAFCCEGFKQFSYATMYS